MTYNRLTFKGLIVLFIIFFTFISSYIISKASTDEDQYIFSKVEDSIYDTLIQNGYTDAGACGILGNMAVENPWFEPDLSANNDATYGLFQWSDVGDRRSNLKKWCNNRMIGYDTVEGQLAFAMYELSGGDTTASYINYNLKHAEDPEKAAMEFAAGFERCIGETSNPEADGIYTGVVFSDKYGKVYQGLTNRKNNAKKYYEGYHRAERTSNETLEIKIVPTAGIIAEKEEAMEERLHLKLPVVGDVGPAMEWFYRLLCLVTGYLFGCILGINLIIRSVRQKEALHFKEKLPSLYMVLKHVGIKECVLAALIDILKMYSALLVIYLITKGALGSEQVLLVGFGVLLGNAYPFWRKFKGGMGLVVTTVFLCTYMPIWGYICCLLGLIVAILLRSLPFGAICICIFAVPYAFACKGIEGGIFITLAMIIVIHKHYRFIRKFISKELVVKHYRRGKQNKKNPSVAY